MNAFKIGFIGLGLIGGSVAKSIHRIFPNYTIIGYDVNTVTLKEAQADGVPPFDALHSTYLAR